MRLNIYRDITRIKDDHALVVPWLSVKYRLLNACLWCLECLLANRQHLASRKHDRRPERLELIIWPRPFVPILQMLQFLSGPKILGLLVVQVIPLEKRGVEIFYGQILVLLPKQILGYVLIQGTWVKRVVRLGGSMWIVWVSALLKFRDNNWLKVYLPIFHILLKSDGILG